MFEQRPLCRLVAHLPPTAADEAAQVPPIRPDGEVVTPAKADEVQLQSLTLEPVIATSSTCDDRTSLGGSRNHRSIGNARWKSVSSSNP